MVWGANGDADPASRGGAIKITHPRNWRHGSWSADSSSTARGPAHRCCPGTAYARLELGGQAVVVFFLTLSD